MVMHPIPIPSSERLRARPGVLVVDDQPALCTALRMILELEGHRVRTTTNGAAALAEATHEPPAVVLLDVQMPAMDGYQTQAALHAALPQVPVVFMTAGDRAWRAAATHGAAGALPKPFDVDLVLDTVARFIPAPAP